MQLRSPSATTTSAAELLLILAIAASPGERDLLAVLMDGASPIEAANQLGLSRATLSVRLHRLRRRASQVAKAVRASG